MKKYYQLPKLTYDYKDLEPFISERLLKIHHQKHHQGYVDGANTILEKMEKARKEGKDLDMKSILKALSFNIGGHLLHSIFWQSMAPKGKGGKPTGKLVRALKKEFGSVAQFRKEFIKTAVSVEGSGWAALAFCRQLKRPLIMQIEKHNVNIYPAFGILLVLDVWEHAYYLDYQNKRAEFVEGFFNVVDWKKVGQRLG